MREKDFVPKDDILQKYARLIVRFGLRGRDGSRLKRGSVVRFDVPDVAKPMYYHLQNEILKAGFHPLGKYMPTDSVEYNISQSFFMHANKSQREFFPEVYSKASIDQIDARIAIIAETLPGALKDIDPKKVMQKINAQAPVKKWFFEKVDDGNLNWTLAFWGTEAVANEAGMSQKAYWQQIIKACYLDTEDPVKEWEKINRTVQKTAKILSDMKIDSLLVIGKDVNLEVGIGAERAWRAGGGNNIPSYEVFTSPDCRRVNGWINFNRPLYDHYGNLIDGIKLTFKDGVCVKANASKNEHVLKQHMKLPGGNRLGEFSLTDSRLSRITKFMANTLYDENTGGKFGNMHVAIGSAYRDCFQGNKKPQTDSEWDNMGYNYSVLHEDIVSTTDRTVTAKLGDGSTKVIYKAGKFCV